jgi:hypothetical protein
MNKFHTLPVTLIMSAFLFGPVMLYAGSDENSGFHPACSRLKSDADSPESKDRVNPEANLKPCKAININPVTVHLSEALIKDGVRPDPVILNQVTEYFLARLKRSEGTTAA